MGNFEKRIKLIEERNIQQENEIINSKTINKERLKVFVDWFEDCSASTINFLVGRLQIIKSIIESGNHVTIEEEPVLILSTQDDLKKWIKGRFDESLIEDVYNE
ncbi:hypothetical protein [Flavobacterium sp.]|uniref:hypothetical protein n=1 Tax=Flavobacterium sp. TaxID=239 RepID=UPI003750B81D